jgi:hypothetical protein
VLLNIFQQIFTEHLWFRNLDFSERFWTEIWAKILLFVGGALVSFGALFFAMRGAAKQIRAGWELSEQKPELTSLITSAALAIIMGSWAAGLWEQALLFLNQEPTTLRDPIFGNTISFYLFSLPFLTELLSWLMFLFVVSIGGIVLSASVQLVQQQSNQASAMLGYPGIRKRLLLGGSLLFLGLMASSLFGLFELLYSRSGVVTGAGWVDVNIRVAGHWVTAALYLVISAFLGYSALRPGPAYRLLALEERGESNALMPTRKSLIAPGIVVAILLIVNSLVPSILTGVYVGPNEITLEEPYIEHNIDYTQRAYGLSQDRVTSEAINVSPRVTPAAVEANRKTVDNVRLWDPGALMDNLQQQQEIRLYYEFNDVDIDRYEVDGEPQQMMVSVRELEKSELPAQAQTWVSRKIKYTHGHGMVMLPVHDITEDGRPNYYIRNIPPEATKGDLQVTRPEIYYGERTNDYVYVKTTEPEFDYPSGNENVTTFYEGDGGVTLGNGIMRFLYAWRFDDYRQLFSSYFTEESRVLFNRDVVGRAKRIAPFLIFDRDPYPVLTDDGRIKYILDAYSVSSSYPYSEAYAGTLAQFQGRNYIRNSVKAVVDAYDGDVTFYVADENDPIIGTYQNMFPQVFRPIDEMASDIRGHIRYPQDYLTVQAEMYRVYHMDNVQSFYQREDEWEFATERYRANFQRVTPYYAMVSFPDSDRVEFVLLLPFTPRNRNVLNAWFAGRSDPPNYGQVRVYNFPKGVDVLGPRQIEARVDQNAEMSQSLSLWDQEGSEVIRGNLLTIPLFHNDLAHLMFVEPIFLQAQDAQLPEVRRIVLADQQRVVWSADFDRALELLLAEREREEDDAAVVADQPAGQQGAVAGIPPDQLQEARSMFQEYQRLYAQGQFAQAGQRLEELRSLINDLAGDGTGDGAGPDQSGGG